MKTKTIVLFFLFLLIFSVPVMVKAQPTMNLTVSTDKQSYYGFTPVVITGILQYNGVLSNDGLVGLQVQDSIGNIIIIRTLKTGTSNPSSLPAKISSAYLSDLSANPQSSIQAGLLGYFAINFINNDNVACNMLVTINLYDNEGIPLGEVSGSSSLLAGQSGTAILSSQIPTWAHSGVAYGYADIYTDWPSKGGFPISLEQPFQFTITGGLISNSNDVASSTGSQGSYSFTFRLPTEGSGDGTYNVFVSSSYSGVSALKSVSFNAVFADFNDDGVVDFNDIAIFVSSYIQCNEGFSNYNTQCDMNHDGKINYTDITLLVDCYIAYWSG